ncbi:MAG: ABC transporter ATP-binding protein [Actinomycetota bacterium]
MTGEAPASAGTVGEAIFNVLRTIGISPSVGSFLMLLVIGLGLKAIAFILAMRQAGYAAADFATDLRLELIRALIGARWKYFSGQPVGALTNSVGTEAMRASQMFTEACYLVAGIVQVAVYIVLAVLVSWYVTFGALILGAAMFFVFSFLVKIAYQAGRRETDLLKSLIGRLADGLGAIKPLKAMAREGAVYPLLEAETRELNQAQRRQILSKASLPALQEPLVALFMALGIYVAVSVANVPFNQLIFMAIIFHRIVSRVGNVQSYFQSVASLESAYWSLRSAIDEARQSIELHPGTKTPSIREGIALRNIWLMHDAVPVLEDLSLALPAGHVTALIGPSGVGKTTIVDLLTGLLTPDRGEILLDGTPLHEIDLRRWRERIGYVPQETILLHESILKNVALEDSSITYEDVEAALTAAQAWDFVSKLPDGIETPVGERGVKLSGGQRQRIAIARALIRSPDLLILDEATFGLDPNTEAAVLSGVRAFKHPITIVAISHQPSLMSVADAVYRIEPVVGPEPITPETLKAYGGVHRVR